MKRYRASLNGKNFRLGSEEVVGFFTTRWVKAKTPELAEEAAVALVRNDKALIDAINNQKNDPPLIYLEELVEVGWWEFFRRQPGSGYTFYPIEEG